RVLPACVCRARAAEFWDHPPAEFFRAQEARRDRTRPRLHTCCAMSIKRRTVYGLQSRGSALGYLARSRDPVKPSVRPGAGDAAHSPLPSRGTSVSALRTRAPPPSYPETARVRILSTRAQCVRIDV